jgi:ketosteroid isomerase-like protein
MAEQNADVLRRIYEAFNERDIDGLLDGFDPEIEIEETEDLAYAALLLRVLGPRFVILSGRYQGLSEVRALFEGVWEIAEWFIVEPEEFIETKDHVIVPLRLHAKTKDTELEGDALTAHVWTMRAGKAQRLQVYANKTDALKAAGSPGAA